MTGLGQTRKGDRTLRSLVEMNEERAGGWLALAVVLCATFMSTLDFFIVNVAIPSLASDLDASSGQIQWIVAGFSLAVGVGVITGGRLGDIYGRRRVFAIGLAAFTLSSALCGLVPGADALIAARVVQGLATAVMTPQVIAIIRSSYADRALARAFTAYGVTLGLAAVFGQLIGGVLISADLFGFGWRSCFLINVPVGILGLFATFAFVDEGRGTRSRIDLIGVVTITIALIALVLPLINGREEGWPGWTWASFGASAGLLALFATYQLRLAARGAEPLIDPAIFGDRAFRSGIVAQLIAWMGQGSFFLVLAVYLQEGRGLSSIGSGLLFTSIGGGYLATSVVSGLVVARLGKQTVALGAALMVVGLTAMGIAAHGGGSVLWLTPGLAIDGAGMGLVIAPMTSLVLAQVSRRHVGAASGILNTINQMGGALGIAVIGIVFYRAGTLRDSFEQSLGVLILIALSVLAAIQFLPSPTQEQERASTGDKPASLTPASESPT